MAGVSSNFTSTICEHLYSISPPKMRFKSIFVQAVFLMWMFSFSAARIFTMEMHHRFSDQVKQWSRRSGKGFPVENWPEKGSVEYYSMLVSHDIAIRRRSLSSSGGDLTFSDGNATFRISSLGL